jgi:hypothetical protein
MVLWGEVRIEIAAVQSNPESVWGRNDESRGRWGLQIAGRTAEINSERSGHRLAEGRRVQIARRSSYCGGVADTGVPVSQAVKPNFVRSVVAPDVFR